MNKVWSKGLDPDQEKELRGDFLSSLLVRKRLVKILEDKIESSIKGSRSKANYDTPNWDRSIADSIGYERALAQVIDIIYKDE
jgi:hypothetical protein